MSQIITHLLLFIQYQNQQIRWLVLFISKCIPLKQWSYDDSNSPKYQKFKTDILPVIQKFYKQDWKFLISYYEYQYGKTLKPIQRRNGKSSPKDESCPCCNAPGKYIYDNNGSKGQYQCKVCGNTFSSGKKVTKQLKLKCPYCGHMLSPKKHRKNFTIHKCINNTCSYYMRNLKSVSVKDIKNKNKHKYKLRYIYREFNVNFFKFNLDSLPDNTSSLVFRKHSAHVMSLCLTFRVNIGLSLRQTTQALNDLYCINISHSMVSNYCRTASLIVKPFIDHFDYEKSDTFIADETYIKVKGLKGYIWIIMDALSRSIIVDTEYLTLAL